MLIVIPGQNTITILKLIAWVAASAYATVLGVYGLALRIPWKAQPLGSSIIALGAFNANIVIVSTTVWRLLTNYTASIGKLIALVACNAVAGKFAGSCTQRRYWVTLIVLDEVAVGAFLAPT